jgi:ADP-ribose pyrophosphatase YjhB (NUDIX family)
MTLQDELYAIADDLRGIADLGLNFSSDPYDRERYEKVLHASARIVGSLESRDPAEIFERYQENFLHVSPLMGAACVVQQEGKILLTKRIDNKKWALPGGLVEVGEVIAQAALRELEEEARINGHVVELLGIFDSKIWHSRLKTHLVHFVFLAEAEHKTPIPGPEAIDADYFEDDKLPELSPGHHLRVPFLFKILRGEVEKPYFDTTGVEPLSI